MDNYAAVLADRDGIIRFWSAGAKTAFGHGAEEALGKTLDLIVPPEHAQAHWEGFRAAMESGSAAAEAKAVPFPALRANGEIAVARGRLTLIRAPDGAAVGAIVVFDQAPVAENGNNS